MLVELCPETPNSLMIFRTRHPSRARGNHQRAGWTSQRACAYLTERSSITKLLNALKARKTLLEVLVSHRN